MQTKRVTSLLLILAMLLPAAACQKKPDPAPSDTSAPAVTSASPADEATTELLRENTPDNLPADLDFKGTKMRFATRDTQIAYKEIICDPTGDIVDDAISDRNRMVEERLGITIEATAVHADPAAFLNTVKNSILSDSDDYDIIAGIQYATLPLALQNCYYNLKDAKYIDLEQPWWWNEYIDEIQIGDEALFFLNGDISLCGIYQMSAIFFNKRLLKDIGTDYDDLYKLVLDGEWTYDKLIELSEKAYNDVNGDGVRDDKDVYGFLARTNTEPDHFTYTSGIRLSTRNEKGYPVLNVNTETFINYMEKLYNLYYANDGIFVTADENLMKTKFANGTSLFLINRFVALSALRDMQDDYGIIPFPKLNAEQKNYQALLHDVTTIYSVPINAQRTDVSFATLEAMCAQNYRTVIPAFYETALKVKYQSDSTAGIIIDMIKAGAHTDFVYAYNYALGGAGLMCRSMITAKSLDFASSWEKIAPQAEKGLEDLIAAFEKADK